MPNFELILNEPHPELRREGWTLLRTADAFRGAQPTAAGFREGALGHPAGSSDLGSAVWREPNRGVMMLRPSALRADLMKNIAWRDTFLRSADFRRDDLELVEIPDRSVVTEPELLVTTRARRSQPLAGISAPLGTAGLPMEAEGLTWVAETLEPLAPNEGFSVLFMASGRVTDRARGVLGLYFGSSWFLVLDTGVQGRFYERVGNEWVLRESFALRGLTLGGNRPFQVTVVPWGIDAISVLVTSANEGDAGQETDFGSRARGFLYEMRRYGTQPGWDAAMGQYIKTAAGSLAIAAPTREHQLAFTPMRVRYAAGAFALAPELLDQPRAGQVPDVAPYGFFGQRVAGGSAANVFPAEGATVPGVRVERPQGGAFDPAQDLGMVAAGWMAPDSSGRYTPEIWAMEYRFESVLGTPSGVGTRLSEPVMRVQGTRETRPAAEELRVTLQGDFASEVGRSLHLGGRIHGELDGTLFFEGHLRERLTGIEGGFEENKSRSLQWMTLEADDLWAQANSVAASHLPALTGRTIGSIVREALGRIGTPNSQIVVAPELEAMEIEGFVSKPLASGSGRAGLGAADDWKIVQENASVGDLLRALIQRYQVQGQQGARPIRIRRRAGQWRVFLAPEWSTETAPRAWFLLDEAVLPSPMDDGDRMAAGYLRVLSTWRTDVERPRFNALRAYAALGSGPGADAVAAFVSPPPAVLADPTFYDFQGTLRPETLGPPETALASTASELERMARGHFDQGARALRTARVEAEWQPFLDADDFVMVLGRDAAGLPASWGAWRVERVAFDVRPGDGPHDWRAIYDLSYAGVTANEDYPMISTEWPPHA